MNSSYVVERTWMTESGLKACCVLCRGTHRCGYVGVNEDNFLYGVKCSQSIEKLKDAYHKAMDINMDDNKRNSISILSNSMKDEEERYSPEMAFNVHGGLTFSNGGGDNDYPIPGDTWWFGFDCAHLGDANIDGSGYCEDDAVVRSFDYVVDECENLAQQIALVTKNK
jgi:hypothetical protein